MLSGLLTTISSPFSSFRSGGGNQAILGGEMEMYYDEKLKRWVDPSDPDSMKPVDDIAPPPTDAQPSAAKGDTPPPAQPAALGAEDAVGDLMTPPPSFRKRRKQSRSVSSPALLSPGKADAPAGFGNENSTPNGVPLPMPPGAATDGPQHTPAQILVPGVPSETSGATPAKKSKTKHSTQKKKKEKKKNKTVKESKKGKDTKKAKRDKKKK